ncbi:MAG: hemN [Armatimonadetes bacterium]|nr:hemN [Armatimonadota bacterium]
MIELIDLAAARPAPELAPPCGVPLALYVHIPFCVRKCYYCDFNSGPASEAIREQYVDVLVEEIRRSPWRGQPARTVFFGGGTPSELNTPQLRRVTDALRQTFVFEAHGEGTSKSKSKTAAAEIPTPEHLNTRTPERLTPEWTIECNPGTITVESLRDMRAMGFNRISLGVQSFHDHHLKAIGRIHSAAQAREAVAAAREAGFERLNLDLIFCLPDQTFAEWTEDVEAALALGPEHLSLYNLTIEENTEFGRRHRLGTLSLPDEDLSADMYEWTLDRMQDAGFVQYEVSNFALPGEECRHNQIYWRQEPSLGFGPSAASYVDGVRWTDTGSMQRYLATAGSERGPERGYEERLDPLTACGESIMLGLRTYEGVDLAAVAAHYGLDAEQTYGSIARRLVEDGVLARTGTRLTLTRRGVMLANRVCAEFLPD